MYYTRYVLIFGHPSKIYSFSIGLKLKEKTVLNIYLKRI